MNSSNLNNQDTQALNNLALAARAFRGTLDEHQALQNALEHVKKRLEETQTPLLQEVSNNTAS